MMPFLPIPGVNRLIRTVPWVRPTAGPSTRSNSPTGWIPAAQTRGRLQVQLWARSTQQLGRTPVPVQRCAPQGGSVPGSGHRRGPGPGADQRVQEPGRERIPGTGRVRRGDGRRRDVQPMPLTGRERSRHRIRQPSAPSLTTTSGATLQQRRRATGARPTREHRRLVPVGEQHIRRQTPDGGRAAPRGRRPAAARADARSTDTSAPAACAIPAATRPRRRRVADGTASRPGCAARPRPGTTIAPDILGPQRVGGAPLGHERPLPAVDPRARPADPSRHVATPPRGPRRRPARIAADQPLPPAIPADAADEHAPTTQADERASHVGRRATLPEPDLAGHVAAPLDRRTRPAPRRRASGHPSATSVRSPMPGADAGPGHMRHERHPRDARSSAAGRGRRAGAGGVGQGCSARQR